MVQQQASKTESQRPPAFAGPGRKPPSESPKSALFLVTSPGGISREIRLACGEEKPFLNRRIKLKSVSPCTDELAYSASANAVLIISHPGGPVKNSYVVEEGRGFPYGNHSFRLIEVR